MSRRVRLGRTLGSAIPGDSASRKRRSRRSVSFRLPSSLRYEMQSARVEDGYTERRQSQWIEEALFMLFEHDPRVLSSSVGDAYGERSRDFITLRVSEDGYNTLQDLVTSVRANAPTLEGVQSLVLRSAIRFRLHNRTASTRSHG